MIKNNFKNGNMISIFYAYSIIIPVTYTDTLKISILLVPV